jgi:hypothetical protein
MGKAMAMQMLPSIKSSAVPATKASVGNHGLKMARSQVSSLGSAV